MRDFFMAAPYWPGVRPGLSHHSFYTSSEEPPLSNFNRYWDIPPLIVNGLQTSFVIHDYFSSDQATDDDRMGMVRVIKGSRLRRWTRSLRRQIARHTSHRRTSTQPKIFTGISRRCCAGKTFITTAGRGTTVE